MRLACKQKQTWTSHHPGINEWGVIECPTCSTKTIRCYIVIIGLPSLWVKAVEMTHKIEGEWHDSSEKWKTQLASFVWIWTTNHNAKTKNPMILSIFMNRITKIGERHSRIAKRKGNIITMPMNPDEVTKCWEGDRCRCIRRWNIVNLSWLATWNDRQPSFLNGRLNNRCFLLPLQEKVGQDE